MFDRLKDNITGIKKAAGVFIQIMPDDSLLFHFTIIKRKNNEIYTEEYETTGQFEQLFEKLDKNLPIFLNIDGKGVLHKKNTLGADKKAAQQIFPNIKPGDFYFQFYQPVEGNGFISLIRKEVLNEIYKIIREKGSFIISISLGPFYSIFLKKNILKDHSELIAGISTIVMEDERIFSIQQNSPNLINYYLDDVKISSVLLPVFSQLLTHFSGKPEEIITDEEMITDGKEFSYFHKFRIFGIGILVVLFGLLLINYLLFDTYQNRLNTLSVETQQIISDAKKIEKLQTDLRLAEKILNNSGIKKDAYFSYYGDRIASLLPQSIVLEEMWIQPLTEKIKTLKEIQYENNSIQIRGNTKYDTQLNSWIQEMENEVWVKDITIVEYEREESGNRAQFEIEILIK